MWNSKISVSMIVGNRETLTPFSNIHKLPFRSHPSNPLICSSIFQLFFFHRSVAIRKPNSYRPTFPKLLQTLNLQFQRTTPEDRHHNSRCPSGAGRAGDSCFLLWQFRFFFLRAFVCLACPQSWDMWLGSVENRTHVTCVWCICCFVRDQIVSNLVHATRMFFLCVFEPPSAQNLQSNQNTLLVLLECWWRRGEATDWGRLVGADDIYSWSVGKIGNPVMRWTRSSLMLSPQWINWQYEYLRRSRPESRSNLLRMTWAGFAELLIIECYSVSLCPNCRTYALVCELGEVGFRV